MSLSRDNIDANASGKFMIDTAAIQQLQDAYALVANLFIFS